MKSKFLLAALVLATAAQAQFTSGGGGAFSFGAMSAPVDKLAAFAPGVEMPSNTAFSWGGYGYFQFNKFLVGFKGYGYYGGVVENDSYTMSNDGGSFLIDFGYKIVNQERLFVYPFVGAGIGGFGHNRSQKGNIDLIDGMMPQPNNFSASWVGAVFDVGFRVEKMLSMGERGKGERGGGFVGLEAGYQFSPENNNWKTAGRGDISNAPNFAFNGFYVRALLGGFGGR